MLGQLQIVISVQQGIVWCQYQMTAMTCKPYLYQRLLLGRLLVCACQLAPPALQLLLQVVQGRLLPQVPCLLLLVLLALQLLLVLPAMSGGGSAEPVLQPVDAKYTNMPAAIVANLLIHLPRLLC